MISAYLAGPDVFLPNAVAHGQRKIDICARYGIHGRAPLNESIPGLGEMPPEQAWWAIYRKDISMMEECDVVIANLTPFRGASADSGTLIEVGWFLGRGRPIFGYSNTATLFDARSRNHVGAIPDPVPGLAVEGFGLSDNLMIEGAVMDGSGSRVMLPERDLPFDSLDVFETCVAAAAKRLT
jgi:nucleoside 2-deoxyribosyltransferase